MAHGQMDAKPLEAVMLKFFRREADVLVASAIIQSGIDVPHANTIIVNRADTFGLAQLYQLRGRVGRSGDQAYAYFLVPDEGRLTDDAQKRLTAIQQFTELGSGFRIAAADLEIRGAGNLLGKQQSGHIAAIGLDLYMQMVEQAVQRLKGQIVEEEPDPTLRLNVSALSRKTMWRTLIIACRCTSGSHPPPRWATLRCSMVKYRIDSVHPLSRSNGCSR